MKWLFHAFVAEIVCPDAGKLLGTGGSFYEVMVMVMDAGLLVSEPSLAVYEWYLRLIHCHREHMLMSNH